MNQEKTGRFIAERRKVISMTQQELADALGISNKTVSKWECGNGLPEVSLMLPLCEILGISVNELLSGEKLEESYAEKAEENIVELMQEKERERWSHRKIIFWQGASVFLSLTLWFLLFADSNMYQLGQTPTPVTLCYLIAGFILIYGAVSACGYGVLKRNMAMVCAALSFASLVCLLICLAYRTLWLVVPVVAGLAASLALSIIAFIRRK